MMGRAEVEAAVAKLSELLADGDPEDAELRVQGNAVLDSLRRAYRADPKAFTPEMIEALKEFADILR